jgi:hypothetical protein
VATLRFCAYQNQHLPFPDLTERWGRAEQLGFDVLWNVDTVVEPDRRRHTMFDGPATLALMAERTSTIRIGTPLMGNDHPCPTRRCHSGAIPPQNGRSRPPLGQRRATPSGRRP